MGRYDYPDPGTDPAYCDGLSIDWRDEIDEHVCVYCGGPLPARVRDAWEDPTGNIYCSHECVINAERESE